MGQRQVVGVGGNVVDTLLVKGDADDLTCGRERGQVAIIAAAAVAQARWPQAAASVAENMHG